LAEGEAREERRRRGRPRVRPPKPEEELRKVVEYLSVLRNEISATIESALEPVQRVVMPAVESMAFIIDDSVQRATAPATGAVLGLLPTLVPVVIESLRESLTRMPDVSHSACAAYIPDVCAAQCGELISISAELPSACYRRCSEEVGKLCRAGAEGVRAFIERQLERIESLVAGVISYAPMVTADIPQIKDGASIFIRRR
jgi:hypothetical protein